MTEKTTLLQNLRKMMFYNPNVNLVHDDVYTKFGKILSIHSQAIEQKLFLSSIKGRNSIANLQKNYVIQSQHRSCQ